MDLLCRTQHLDTFGTIPDELWLATSQFKWCGYVTGSTVLTSHTLTKTAMNISLRSSVLSCKKNVDSLGARSSAINEISWNAGFMIVFVAIPNVQCYMTHIWLYWFMCIDCISTHSHQNLCIYTYIYRSIYYMYTILIYIYITHTWYIVVIYIYTVYVIELYLYIHTE